MPIAAVVEWPSDTGLDPKAEYQRAADELNGGRPFSSPADWGGGLISHVFAVAEDGSVLAVDVWEDRASMDAWMQKLGPVLEGRPQPQVRVFQTLNVVTEGQPVSRAS
jgi:hypothetical protein